MSELTNAYNNLVKAIEHDKIYRAIAWIVAGLLLILYAFDLFTNLSLQNNNQSQQTTQTDAEPLAIKNVVLYAVEQQEDGKKSHIKVKSPLITSTKDGQQVINSNDVEMEIIDDGGNTQIKSDHLEMQRGSNKIKLTDDISIIKTDNNNSQKITTDLLTIDTKNGSATSENKTVTIKDDDSSALKTGRIKILDQGQKIILDNSVNIDD